MKKFIVFILSVITLSTTLTATAAEIPRASAPENATLEQIVIVENLIGDVLDEVNAGAGYGMTSSCADTRIRKAVMADQTDGNGYAILSAISNNALRFARDIYMRPEVYTQYEEYLRVLLADIIIEVENGRDYNNAKDAAYTRIYQSINPSCTPREIGQDFCYMDTPAVDSAMFYVARKLLLEAVR